MDLMVNSTGYPDVIRRAESALKKAEEELLSGKEGIAERLLVGLSNGMLASDAEKARERMKNLDESRYVKWERWKEDPEFSVPFWKDEGYLSIDSSAHQSRDPDWYSKMAGTSGFVAGIRNSRKVKMPTLNGKRDGEPTPLGKPANTWLLDFVALSSLRLSFKSHWEQLVRDIVRKRNRTDLNLVAKTLGLEPHFVVGICQKIKNLDDKIVELDPLDSTMNMTYTCRNPDPSLQPLIDIQE
jgi:hypothetical protein